MTLSRRTASHKVLCDNAFNIAKILKYDGYQCRLALLVYNFFDKKSSGVYTSGGAIKSRIMLKQQLADELQKSITRKLENIKYNHLLTKIFGVLI